MDKSTISRRNSLKLFALTGTTLLTMPGYIFSSEKQNSILRFSIITDSHYADREPSGTRFYRDSIPKMQEAIDSLNTQNLDFIIHLGDFKDEDTGAQPGDTLAYLDKVEAVFQKFKGPKYHDVDSITKQQFLNHIANTGQEKAESYYAFTANGMRFIVLDANYDADGTSHFFANGSDWENANIPEKELNWLADQLESWSIPTVVFCHHPLYEFYKEEAKFTQLGMVDYEGVENNAFSIVEITSTHIKIEGYKRASDHTIMI